MSEAAAPRETQSKSAPVPGPLDPFREMRDNYLTAMAKNMAEVVNTEGYAQATGAILNGYLGVSGPFKEALDKSMLQALEQLSLPSRVDIISLAERFTNLEMRLDDMDAKLDGLVRLVSASPAAAGAKVPVRRRAAKKTARAAKQAGRTTRTPAKAAKATSGQTIRSRRASGKESTR